MLTLGVPNTYNQYYHSHEKAWVHDTSRTHQTHFQEGICEPYDHPSNTLR